MTDHAIKVCFYCADQNPHRDRSLGITNYTAGLLRHLHENNSVGLQAVVSKSSAVVPDEIPKTVLPFRTDHVPGRLLADHFHALLIGSKIDADIWHYPKGFVPFGSQVRQPKVGTVADTIIQFYADHYPQSRSRAGFAYWIAMLKNAIRRFDVILTVSDFSKRSILEFADRHRLKKPNVVVTYQGVDVEETSAEEKENYVLHLASAQPHKRTNWLLNEWSKLELSDRALRLRLIGHVDRAGRELAASAKNVELLPPMSRSELGQVMKSARALILPSEIEGFGLPALEAYYSGTPVAYVKGTAVEEIVGFNIPGAFTFDEWSFSNALNEVLKLNASEIDLKRVELQERFAWSNCTERTMKAYRSLITTTV